MCTNNFYPISRKWEASSKFAKYSNTKTQEINIVGIIANTLNIFNSSKTKTKSINIDYIT